MVKLVLSVLAFGMMTCAALADPENPAVPQAGPVELSDAEMDGMDNVTAGFLDNGFVRDSNFSRDNSFADTSYERARVSSKMNSTQFVRVKPSGMVLWHK
jgi:hypothetical protein